MSVYGITGEALTSVYSQDGTEILHAYDSDGNTIYSKSDDPYIDGRTLLFEECFDGESLDLDVWSYETGNTRAGELQFYRSQNVSFENSNLLITAKKETHLNKNWTSGSITSQLKKFWTYGRFEAKIKFPGVVGAFGAFWTLGANHWINFHPDDDPTIGCPNPEGSVNWPECGEIDIIETIPGNTTTPPANLWKYSGGSFGTGSPSQGVDMSEYHIYSMEWTEEYIAMLIDDMEFKRWTFANYSASEVQAYHLPQCIILNLAVGSAGGTPASSTNEMKMYVDWVRVYAPLSN